MLKLECNSGDIFSEDILNAPNEEWSVITNDDIMFYHMEDLLGINWRDKSRCSLVPARFDRKSQTLHMAVISEDNIENADYLDIEIYFKNYYSDEKEQQKLLDDIEAVIEEAPKAPLHTVYMVALMDYYFKWNDTDTYDKLIHILSQLKLPDSYRQKQFPLYRGLSISKQAYAKMKNGEPFKLKKRVGTSWGKSKSRPIFVARKNNKGGNIIVIELKPNSKLHVILNGYAVKKDPLIKELVNMSYKLYPSMFDEVILKGNGGLVYVTPNMVLNSRGKKLTTLAGSFVKNNIRYVYV